MKNYLLFMLLLTCPILSGQVAFRHVTTAANTSAHITTLDHPQLNGKPDALLFILPNYNQNGAEAGGQNYQQNAGVWYNGSHWTIFNQNTKEPMPLNMTFNVMIAPAGNPNCFTFTVTEASKTNFVNGALIDHPATNGKTDAMLLVTQNWAGVYLDASQVTEYWKGKWSIFNNGYDDYYNGKTKDMRWQMPVGARFNVMVIENKTVPGFPNAQVFQHTAKRENIYKEGPITYLEPANLAGNKEVMLFATAYWGHADADRKYASQGGGPYNDGPLVASYDHPDDQWKHGKDTYWSLYNSNGKPMPEGAKMHVVAVRTNVEKFAGSSPATLVLNKLVYKSGDNIKCTLITNGKLQIEENKYVAYVSPGTKDVEVVQMVTKDKITFVPKKGIRVLKSGIVKKDDGVLRTVGGETIVAYYFIADEQKQAMDSALTFIADFAMIEGAVKESVVVVNADIRLSNNEKDQNGAVISGTLMAGHEMPIEVAAGQVIFNARTPADLKTFLEYAQGRLLGSIPMSQPDMGEMHLIEVNLNDIKLANLSMVRATWGPKDTLRGSNQEVLKLIQFCIQAQMEGFPVSPNPKFGFSNGDNNCDCPSELVNPVNLPGEILPEGFRLTFGAQGRQWIPAVWNFMAIWDKDREFVNVGVIDQGFNRNVDYGPAANAIPQCQVIYDNGIRVNCAENAAMGPPTVGNSGVFDPTWHGNAVWARIGGVLNNGPQTMDVPSTAGVAAQVARPVLVKIGGADAYAFGIATAIQAAVNNNAQVINISGGYPCRLLLNILGWGPNICSAGGRSEICAAVGPVIFGGASIACEATFRWWCPPCADNCQAGVATTMTAFIQGCISQIGLINPPDLMNDAIQFAKSRGVPVVASAGNIIRRSAFEGRLPNEVLNLIDLSENRMTVEDWQAVPAVLPDVICVGAADSKTYPTTVVGSPCARVNTTHPSGHPTPFWNTQVFGNRVDIWGPEDGFFIAPTVTTPAPAEGYVQALHECFNGTSSSAPFITGLIANAMAVNPFLNPRTTTLSALERSQIPTNIRNLLTGSAFQQANLPFEPSNRRRNLVNPMGFMLAANNFRNGGVPDLPRYDKMYNFNGNEPFDDSPDGAGRITGSLFSEQLTTGAIVHIPSASNNAPAITDKDFFSISVPATPGSPERFNMELVLTTPRGDRFGNLHVRGNGLQLISTTLVGSNEEAKIYRVNDLAESMLISVEGVAETDDNLYELKVMPLVRQGANNLIGCNNAPAVLPEGIYTIRLNINQKSLDAPDMFNVHLWDFHGGANQKWHIKPLIENGNQVHTILNMANGNFLGDNSLDGCDGADNGDRVFLTPARGWQIENSENGTFLLRSLCPEYQVLEGQRDCYHQNGCAIVFQQCATGTTNKWNIQRIADVITQHVQPQAVFNFCPQGVSGDFNGNGPWLTGDVTLRIAQDGREVEAVVNITARGTGSNLSVARGNFVRTIFTAPDNMRILLINSATRTDLNQVLVGGGRFEPFEGCDGGEHTLTPGGPVARILMVGDTGGYDISVDADCNCETRINRIDFNPLNITLAPR